MNSFMQFSFVSVAYSFVFLILFFSPFVSRVSPHCYVHTIINLRMASLERDTLRSSSVRNKQQSKKCSQREEGKLVCWVLIIVHC
uniref:Putative secreted protein n=1 Tax=Anopheles darlingi TaxID=43151 RepID=A0A2M4DAH7_ANODA